MSRKWPNEEMWAQAVLWRKGGLTYGEICGQLSRPESRKRFGLKELPSEDTTRREVCRRLFAEQSGSVLAAGQASRVEQGDTSSTDLKPDVAVGAVYAITTAGATHYLQVVSLRVVPPGPGTRLDFGPLGPGEERTVVAVKALGLTAKDLVKIRVRPIDDLVVSLESEVKSRGTTMEPIDLFTANDDPEYQTSTFWLWGGDEEWRIRVLNPTGYPIRVARIGFLGWRMRVEPVVAPPEAGRTLILQPYGW